MDKSKANGISAFGSALVWFGAAVSIAEIEAGSALAPAAAGGRLSAVLSAILLGHLLGGALALEEAEPRFHARLSATGKSYLYPLFPFNWKALRELLVRRPISRQNT